MLRQIRYFLNYLVVTILSVITSCTKINEQDFFRFNLKSINSEKVATCRVIPDFVTVCDCQLFNSVIVDSLVIAEESNSDFRFSVNNLNTREILGFIGKKGRGPNEFISSVPISECYKSNDDLMIELFSFQDSKLFTCNITESLSTGTTVYEQIVNLDSNNERILALHSVYCMNDDEVLVYNSMQNPFKTELDSAPMYQIYSKKDGRLLRSSNIFNNVSSDINHDQDFSSSVYMNNHDCIKPDRTKVVMAMAAMPVVNIITLSDFKANGFKLDDKLGFSTESPVMHYIDVQADDEYIYALYLGSDLSSSDYTTELHVFDWNGVFHKKVLFDMSYEAIRLTNHSLYLFTYSDNSLYSVDISELR